MEATPLPGLRSAFGRENFAVRHAPGLATGVVVALYLVGGAIAVAGGFGAAYVASGSVYVVLAGTMAGSLLLLWGGAYHLTVWERVRGCFDASEEAYDDALDPLLDRTYSGRRIALEYLVSLAIVGVVDLSIGIPMAVDVGTPGRCVLDPAGACVSHLVLLNYVYGLVALFVVVAGVHAILYFLLVVDRVTDLPIAEVDTAAERLEPIAHFSIFVSTSLFGGAILVSAVYARYLTGSEDGPGIGALLSEHVVVVTAVVAGLIGVGLLVFWLPQMAIHARLSAAKQDRLAEIGDEYERLLAWSRAGDRSPEALRAELEILDARRRNAKEIRTWSYNLPTLLPFVGSAAGSAVMWFVQFAQTVGL